MDNILKQTTPTPEQLDIYVKRILAKYANEEQILFAEQVSGTTPVDQKVPLDFCVDKKLEVGTANYLGVKCIQEVKITDWNASEEIICNHKAKLIITYKVVLWIKYEDNSFGIVVLPDDVYKSNPTASFISNMAIPQTIGNNETLEIIDIGTNPKFKWTKSVPLTEFDAVIPPEAFDDPTIQSHLLIKAIRPEYDILNDCPYAAGGTTPVIGRGPHAVGHNQAGTAEGGIYHSEHGATEILLSLYVDLLDKLGIDQDVLIEGIPFDC